MNKLNESTDIEAQLEAWTKGDAGALSRLLPLVYGELRKVAHTYFEGERCSHTLQTTELVNEAYLKIRRWNQVSWQSKGQFYAFAGQVMRRILVDYARKRRSLKRGGRLEAVPLDEALGLGERSDLDLDTLLDLDEALEKLREVAPRQAEVVSLRFFGGLENSEIAELIGISRTSVKRDWSAARAWLATQIKGPVDEQAEGQPYG